MTAQTRQPNGSFARGEAGERRLVPRRKRPDEWTDDKREEFFAALSVLTNVAAACRDVKMSPSGAYALRRSDAGFRQRWEAAIAEGYAHLEMQAVHDARFGQTTTKVERADADGKTTETVYVSDRLRLWLLSRHRETAERERAAALAIEARAEIEDEDAAAERFRVIIAERRAARNAGA